MEFLSPSANPKLTTEVIDPKRRLLLIYTWLGIILTAIYLIASKKPISIGIFPDTIAVNSWQQVKIKYLSQYKYKSPITDKFEIVESRKDYSYFKNGQKLAVQMRYVVNTRGQSNPFVYQLSKNLVKDSQNNIRQLKEVGYYTLYNDSKQAYITACINPRGGSTVTSSQFMKNQYKYDLS